MNRGFVRVFLLMLCLVHNNGQTTETHINTNGIPGGIAQIDLGMPGQPDPQVWFGQRRIMVKTHNQRAYALVGLSASLLPGNYILKVVDDNEESLSRRFRVSPLDAELAQRSRSIPPALNGIDLIIDENRYAIDYDKDFDTHTYDTDFRFLTPVEPKMLVPFGLLIPESNESQPIPHFGITYFANQDALVYAPARGRISQIREMQDGSQTVYIHHGGSLQSVLAKLSERVVQIDQEVQQGELIGVVSNSQLSQLGRIDWGVLLNGALIDTLDISKDQEDLLTVRGFS